MPAIAKQYAPSALWQLALMIPQTRLGHPQATLSRVMVGAEQVVQRLRTLSASVGPSAVSSQFYTRTRAKAIDSIQGKIRFLRSKPATAERPATPDYSFRDITDYAGFRIVTLYDDDLLKAINHIIETVRAGQNLAEPLFAKGSIWDSFHDGIFNARTESQFVPSTKKDKQNDIYYKCLVHLVESIDTYYDEYNSATDYPKPSRSNEEVKQACKPRPRRPDRYSSAHLTFWANSYHPNNLILPIPVEFQIRTAVEDVWGEINHKLLYKSRSPYIWSLDYERSLREASHVSGNLKTTIDDYLPKEIARFHSLATRAQLIAEDFWGDKKQTTDWRERKANTHVSLCAALIVMVSDGEVTGAISEALKSYEGLIKTLSGQLSSDDEEAAKTLSDCIRHLSTLLENINQDGVSTDEVVDEQRKQRTLLLNIEIARLEVIMALLGYYYQDGRAIKIPLPPSQGPEEEASANSDNRIDGAPNHEPPAQLAELSSVSIQRKLYERLCEFLTNPDLLIKPITMLYVWKHLLSRKFGDEKEGINELEEINLASAYDMLDRDPTLPSWSIYRVVVPYLRARLLLRQARRLHSTVASGGVVPESMFGLRTELMERLDTSFRFAIDAFEEHTDPIKAKIESRGDIAFLRESYKPIRQANLVMAVVIAFHELLKMNVVRRNKITTDQINRIYKYARTEIRRFRDGDDLRSEIGTLRPVIQSAIHDNFKELTKLRKRR